MVKNRKWLKTSQLTIVTIKDHIYIYEYVPKIRIMSEIFEI